MDKELMTCRDVQNRVSLGRSTVYRLVAAGQFPRPVRIGGKAVRWLAREIDDWIEEQAASRTERSA